ncbi:MAG: hypothetical protein WC152_03880, partial [Candidatus Izemoplasmatales bacterium]
MNIIVLFISIIASLLIIFLVKDNKKKNKIKKVLAIILFLVYLIRLFSSDSINSVFNVLLYDIETPINSETTWLFSPGMTIFIIILRWLTLVSLLWVIIHPYIKGKEIKVVGSVLAVLVGTLNFLFFKQHLIAFEGVYSIWSFRSIQYLVETGLLLILGIYILSDIIINKERINIKKTWYRYLFIISGSLFALMPQTLLSNLFGYYGEVPEDFSA